MIIEDIDKAINIEIHTSNCAENVEDTLPGTMSLLSWNCRGLGNPQTVNAIKKAIRIKKPKLIFSMETKFDKEWVVGVRDR